MHEWPPFALIPTTIAITMTIAITIAIAIALLLLSLLVFATGIVVRRYSMAGAFF